MPLRPLPHVHGPHRSALSSSTLEGPPRSSFAPPASQASSLLQNLRLGSRSNEQAGRGNSVLTRALLTLPQSDTGTIAGPPLPVQLPATNGADWGADISAFDWAALGLGSAR
jgi:hypothetical protein